MPVIVLLIGRYLDGSVSRSAQPVPVWGEAEGMDGLIGFKTVQLLAICDVPQHRSAILQPKHVMSVLPGFDSAGRALSKKAIRLLNCSIHGRTH